MNSPDITSQRPLRRLPGATARLALLLIFCIGPWHVSCSAPESTSTNISVVLVSADSLRVDRLSPWADDAPATPHLDRLVARGTVYLDAWATSPWTAPSMVSVLTGLYPPSHGIVYRDDTTPKTLPTLPRVLESHGYQLGNFSFFSQISYFRNLGLGSPIEGLRHKTVARSFDQWLAGVPTTQPFFAWVHLLETHLPYGATGYRSTQAKVPGSTGLTQAQLKATVPVGTVEFADGDRQRLMELYDQDVRAMDAVLGRLMESLEQRGRLSDTLVVFVADHGEELLDDGWIGHASTSQEAKLLPEILRVPLILAGPGVPAGQSLRQRVQQVDIVPTVLRLAGLEVLRPLDGQILPGLFRLGFSDWWNGTGQGRDLAFFDSSPGGNLTPQSQRGERLQGVTDGTCLLEVHTYIHRGEDARGLRLEGPGDCDPATRDQLRSELGGWRERQAGQRLAVLAANPGPPPPPMAEIEQYTESMEVLTPRSGDTLRWATAQGLVTFEWRGEGTAHWIQYQAGQGLFQFEGSFQLDQGQVVFGPVPQGFWADLAGYSPYRIRVFDPENRQRSAWVDFEVEP